MFETRHARECSPASRKKIQLALLSRGKNRSATEESPTVADTPCEHRVASIVVGVSAAPPALSGRRGQVRSHARLR